MTDNDIELNISKLKTVKIKVIAKASVNFLAQHIERAIKHPDFFTIDYEKYGIDIINNSNISQDEKNKIHEMFKNPNQRNNKPSNDNNNNLQKRRIELFIPPRNPNPKITETSKNDNQSNDKKMIPNNSSKNINPNNDKKEISNDIQKNINPNNDKKEISNDIPKNVNSDNDENDTSNNIQINNNNNDSQNLAFNIALLLSLYLSNKYKAQPKRLDLDLFNMQEKIYKGEYISICKICEISTNKIYAAKKVISDIKYFVRNKLLDFAQEVDISLQIEHPSIIKCIGYGEKKIKDNFKQVIVYDYAPNKSLDLLFDSIRNNQKIVEWNDTKKLINIYGIAAAMSFLHSNQIIHCNLQPNNILLDKDFYPKICDFESSKKITLENQINDSYLRGSPAYVAPEVYSGLYYRKACDVYSFAFIVYELMTNEKPYSNINDGYEIMKTACQKKIRPRFQKPIDENYRELIEKCWSDNPDDRPTFSDILSQLETNKKFITKNVDKEEFYNYIKYIKESEQKYDLSVHYYEFDYYIKGNSDRFEANEIEDYTKDLILKPFELEKELIDKYNDLLKSSYNNEDENEKDNDLENIKLDIHDISRNEVINFCNKTNVMIKINHFTLDKSTGKNDANLSDISFYNESWCMNGTSEYKFKFQRMWDATIKLVLMYGIASGMKYLHSHNILHRDLKPFNIVTDFKKTPQIRGFDLAIMLNNKDKKIIMNEIKGTAAYLAPEVYLKKEYSEKSDVYSYGLLIYEILTEKKPFEKYSNAIEIKEEICDKKRRPEFEQPINGTYRQLIERCWSQNPKDRPTFSEIVKELETNEKFITYQVDKSSYLKYVSFIKGLKSRFYPENKIKNVDDYISFKQKNFTDAKININLIDAFSTETTNIDCSHHIYFNVKQYEVEKNLYDGSNYRLFLIKNKETGIIYAAKTPYYTINKLYQHHFINFFNELNTILQLDHPSVLKFIGFSPVGYNKSKRPLIMTEYASNGSLSKYITPNSRFKKAKKFNETNKIIVLYGVAAAMKYLHSHNILHRDIKSENIFLDSSLHPKIAGFNISIMLNNKDKKIIMNEIKGTAAYLAPEVYLKKEYSEKSDVYSYGLLIYEILTEKKPFEKYSNAIEIKEEICDKKRRPEFEQPINGTYRQLIERCWSQNPKDRPTFSEIVKELETNEKFITSKIDKKEYLKYVKLIKNTKSTLKSSNKIENLDKYINFHLVRHIQFNNQIISKGIYETETNSICFNRLYKNINNLINKRFIADEEYHKSYEFFDKEKNVFYIGRKGKIKIFNSNRLLSKFSKEIEIFAQLKHPALNQFEGYSMFDNKGDPFQIIFSQNAPNNTLYHIIEAENEGLQIKEYDDTKRLITIYGIASAMKYIHEHDIIFRNLRPENILFDEFLHPKVEFVFQYLYYYGADERTNIYLDPSVEYNDYTKYSDVCSFALIVYEILMKKKIQFYVKTEEDMTKVLKAGDRPDFDEYSERPPIIPEVYKELLEKCWSKKVTNRPSFDEILIELKTNPGFITSTINKKEYYKYIQYVDENKTNLEKDFIKYEIDFPDIIKQSKFLANLKPLDLSNYKKDRQIGKGGFGSVYKIYDKKTGDILAAKVSIYEISDCDLDLIQNLSREVEIISQLNHPAILKYIGYSPINFKSKRKPTIITEFAHNGSLDIIIDLERKSMAMEGWDDTKKLINIYGIAAGMKYLHDRDIIHRDLKPANIFMDEQLYPKIGDFGLSRDYNAGILLINLSNLNATKNPVRLSEENLSHEKSGFKGTFAYSAPEILRNEKYTEKGDVFAFGMIVYEIITNEILYKDMNRYDIITKLSNGYRHEFKFPIPYSYKRLIQKCWSQYPEDRPSFQKIVSKIEEDPGFITENIDKEEFLNYVDYVKQTNYSPIVNINQEKVVNKTPIDSNQNLIKVKESDSESIQSLFLNLNQYQKLADISKGDFYKISKIQEVKNKTVYAAKESIIKTPKLSKSESIDISNEIQSILKINYPSLLKIIGYSPFNFKKESKPVFVTELTANGSLDQVLKAERKGNPINGWNDTKRLINIYGIAKGMSYLHSNNILHKDLKTENIYIDKNLYPKVGDFGIPRKVSVVESLSFQSTSGTKGTPVYSAPETLLSYTYSKAGDVYSFAFIVYELMCDEIPFKKMSMNQIFKEVIDGHRPDFIKSLPDCYQQLIEKCWGNDPDERPSFDEIVNHLKTEKEFITDTVNKEEFYSYVKFIDNYK